MKKVLFLFTALLLLIACDKEDLIFNDSKIEVCVYDDQGNKMPDVRVKMYDEEQYELFKQNNLTAPTGSEITSDTGIATFHLSHDEWFAAKNQQFLTFLVQEGGGESNYKIWSTGKTIDAGKDAQLDIILLHR